MQIKCNYQYLYTFLDYLKRFVFQKDIIKKFLNGTESIYQWEIYLKNQKNDYKIFFSKIQKSETVMDDPIECFSYIIMTVQDFQAHIYLKNLANFFLMILITGKKINIYFKVIEQIVGQIVLGSSNIFEDSKYGLLVQGISEIISNIYYLKPFLKRSDLK